MRDFDEVTDAICFDMVVAQRDAARRRIEKLEAALREIADSANWDNAGCWNADSYPDEIARKALEGKDD